MVSIDRAECTVYSRNAELVVEGVTCKGCMVSLNIELEVPAVEEGPGLGAAMLAMVACGEYKTVSECAEKLVTKKDRILPDAEIVARYKITSVLSLSLFASFTFSV